MIRTALLLFLALTATTGYGGSEQTGTASQPLRERPQLEDYTDTDRFIADVLAWERQKRDLQQAASNEQFRQPPETDDWHNVTGPEELDEALRKAYGYRQPQYKEKYRYNRTTHLSFPLEKLESRQLSSQAITGALLETPEEEELSLEPLPELQTILDDTFEGEKQNKTLYSAHPPTLTFPRGDIQSVQVQAR